MLNIIFPHFPVSLDAWREFEMPDLDLPEADFAGMLTK